MRATILHAAEVTFANLFGLTVDEARVLIRDLMRDARPTSRPSHRTDTAIWRAARRWYRARMQVLAPYDGWRPPARDALPAPAPPPPPPPAKPIRDGRSRRRPGVARSADPPSTPPPERMVEGAARREDGVEGDVVDGHAIGVAQPAVP